MGFNQFIRMASCLVALWVPVTHSVAQPKKSRSTAYAIQGTIVWQQPTSQVAYMAFSPDIPPPGGVSAGRVALPPATALSIRATILLPAGGSQEVGEVLYAYALCGDDSVCSCSYSIRDLPADTPIVVTVEFPDTEATRTSAYLSATSQAFRVKGWNGITTLTPKQPVKKGADFELVTESYPFP